MINKIEKILLAWLYNRREKRVLTKCGCCCFCPNCSDILQDQADCTDTDLVRYRCNTCGCKSEWTFDAAPVPILLSHNAHPDRTADQGCSVEGMVEICETCEGTGWYGDNGSGVLGNSEFHECDCCDHSKVEKCSCGWHKYLVVGGLSWCEECNREADLSVCRLFHPPFNMEFNHTSQKLPEVDGLDRSGL